jgi:hypothetical protein
MAPACGWVVFMWWGLARGMVLGWFLGRLRIAEVRCGLLAGARRGVCAMLAALQEG